MAVYFAGPQIRAFTDITNQIARNLIFSQPAFRGLQMRSCQRSCYFKGRAVIRGPEKIAGFCQG